jgi:hypothetical protein
MGANIQQIFWKHYNVTYSTLETFPDYKKWVANAVNSFASFAGK